MCRLIALMYKSILECRNKLEACACEYVDVRYLWHVILLVSYDMQWIILYLMVFMWCFMLHVWLQLITEWSWYWASHVLPSGSWRFLFVSEMWSRQGEWIQTQAYTDTRAHIHTRTHTHARMHAHAHMYAHAPTHTHTCARTHTHAHTHTRTHTHTRARAHTQDRHRCMHACTHSHTQIHSQVVIFSSYVCM